MNATNQNLPVVVRWKVAKLNDPIAGIDIHGRVDDRGVVVQDDKLFASLSMYSEQDVWNMLTPLIRLHERNVSPPIVELSGGIKLDSNLWIPLADALFGMVEVLQLGVPIIPDK